MKKILLLFVAMLTLGVTANAYDSESEQFKNGDWRYSINPDANHEVTVIQYEGPEGCEATELTIPSYVTYNGSRYFVTALGNRLFTKANIYDDDGNLLWSQDAFLKLEKVTIPNSVTMIEYSAFEGCTSLSSVNIPNSVTSINTSAFADCTSLSSVNIPNSVTSIARAVFRGCTSLSSVNIPNSVTSIEESVFRGCTSLSSVNIPNSVTSINPSAFAGCTSLSSVNIPNSVTEIWNHAFDGCTSLTSVTIPKSVKDIYVNPFTNCTNLREIIVEEGSDYYTTVDGILYYKNFISKLPTVLMACPCASTGPIEIPNSVSLISYYAFNGCTSLSSVNIPNSVTRIEYSAFEGCTSLSSVNIPNSVTRIEYSAFEGCTSLSSIVIPNSVTSIAKYVFQGCTSLSSIVIPGSVELIDYYAFKDCSSLKKIVALPTTPPSCGQPSPWNNVDNNAVVYIPKGTFKSYFVADGWDYFTDFREMGAFDVTLSKSTISIEESKTATIIATVTHDDDVTVKSETWATSNPEVATVDDNGVITAVAAGTATITCTVVDSYGCPHTESCEVTVTELSGISGIEVDDSDAPAEYYNLNGVRVNADNLTPGLYIKRQGGKATKVLVK